MGQIVLSRLLSCKERFEMKKIWTADAAITLCVSSVSDCIQIFLSNWINIQHTTPESNQKSELSIRSNLQWYHHQRRYCGQCQIRDDVHHGVECSDTALFHVSYLKQNLILT